jgi:hypothetical protein
MSSTDGSLECAMISCLVGHWFNGPIESLARQGSQTHDSGHAAVTSRARPVSFTGSHDGLEGSGRVRPGFLGSRADNFRPAPPTACSKPCSPPGRVTGPDGTDSRAESAGRFSSPAPWRTHGPVLARHRHRARWPARAAPVPQGRPEFTGTAAGRRRRHGHRRLRRAAAAGPRARRCRDRPRRAAAGLETAQRLDDDTCRFRPVPVFTPLRPISRSFHAGTGWLASTRGVWIANRPSRRPTETARKTIG